MMLAITGCHHAPHHTASEPASAVVILESSPNNLDPRQGTDAQSERVGGLIFDALVKKDEHYNLTPWLAESWEQPTPLTWIFHLRDGVRFQDGRPLEAEDVVWTIESLIEPKLAGLISSKSGAFAAVERAEARDRLTVVVHMKRPDAGLLFNMSDGLFGVVPRGAGKDFGLHPVGSGPFRFVSQLQDKEVVLERFHGCWAEGISANPIHRDGAAMNGAPKAIAGTPGVMDKADQRSGGRIERLHFNVVPDTITSALELQKGSADAASNVLSPDLVYALRNAPGLETASGRGSNVWYMNFNVADPALSDKRVRQAIALAMDRPAIIAALWRGHARLAQTLLPQGHWAAASDADLPQYPHDPARAAALLQAAGHPADRDGVRLHLTLKISTDETTRLLAAVLQQQLRAAGIVLKIRSAEFGTFYSDVTHGAFQMYILKWIGSNEDPDIYRYTASSTSFPPKGANRGHFVSPRVDELLARASTESGPEAQTRRRAEYIEVQKILADDLPTIPLWYPDNVVVHTRRLQGVESSGDGSFDFLRNARIQ
ncbi:MAG: ABC transporter substrate-binding protein [Acidobacteriaceae bacterium]|nr:ABC transporter substrate-binding protein [Acidobacteriaceae bacterium]